MNFPINPTLNQTYTYGAKTWKWDGTAWNLQIAGVAQATVALTGSFSDLVNKPTTIAGYGITDATSAIPKITSIVVTDSSYNNLDDTAVALTGGYIKIIGTGFTTGSQVLINTTSASSVSFVSSTELRAQLPATTAGTYVVYVVAADGSVAIRVNGITFSATPTWTTASTLPESLANAAISIQFAATSNSAVTYAVASGSTLPTGLSLSSGGLLSGTITGVTVATTYNFTINAVDQELQDSPRAFSISISVVQQISRSLRFNISDSAYLSRTFASAGNRKTWTYSGWIKRSGIPSSSGDPVPIFGACSAANDSGFFVIGVLNEIISIQTWNTVFRRTTAVYRDYAAWYHIVVSFDTTQATAANRLKLYVNGVEVTAFSSSSDPTLNTDYPINNNIVHNMFKDQGSSYLGGYLTEVNFIDGQQLTPTSFGEADPDTGVWRPVRYTGTYGTNGYYLNFSDNSNTTATTLGKDYSGNSNNWTPNNFSVTAGVGNDSVVDSPTSYGVDTGVGGEVRGNYATFNPLQRSYGTIAYSDGNLVATNSDNNWNAIGATMGISTGKWYWEYTSGDQNSFFGFQVPTINYSAINPQDVIAAAGSVLICDDNQYKIDNNTRVAYGSIGHPSGTVVGIAVDMDAGTVTYYKNGVNLGTINWTSSVAYGKTVIPIAIVYYNNTVTRVNFGQRPFAYTAPTGYKALCTQNLPTSILPQTAFAANTFSSSGSNRVIGTGIQSDLVWSKRRDATGSHLFHDAVRGAGKTLYGETSNAEVNNGAYYVQGFNSDSYSIGNSDNALNGGAGATYVSWTWSAGGNTVTNTAGTISAQVRANPTAGFSIVTWTGTGSNSTIGHGLGVAPSMVIVKNRTTAGNSWCTWHTNLTSGAYALFLDATNAQGSFPTIWNSTIPTSTVFSVGTATGTNASANNLVAYCFAEIPGYSRFGSYVGNGSTDGPFVYCGFRPRWIMIKNSTAAAPWIIIDAVRNSYNPTNLLLYPNTSGAEDQGVGASAVDFVSNGFKIKTTDAWINPAQTLIFAAFAETPFKYARAR